MQPILSRAVQAAALCALIGAGAAVAGDGALILRNADSNDNTMINGRLVSNLVGNVVFEYDSTVIRSDRALWRRNEGTVNFQGNVRITTGPQTMTSPILDFDKNRKTLVARGGMRFIDTAERVMATSTAATYRTDCKDLTLAGNPAVFKADSTDNDTLIIRGDQLAYDDSLKIAYSYGNTRIVKGELRATCVNASYEVKTGHARLRTTPLIFFDVHDLMGDSVDLFFKNERLSGMSVVRKAVGFQRELDSAKTDTAITRISADSLYMTIADSGTISAIDAIRDGALQSFSSAERDVVNTASGRSMHMDFAKGKARRLTILGNASSLYFLDDATTRDRNESSGDTITVHFKGGKAAFLDIRGGVRGTYYTESKK